MMPRRFLKNLAFCYLALFGLFLGALTLEAVELSRMRIPTREIPKILVRRTLNEFGLWR